MRVCVFAVLAIAHVIALNDELLINPGFSATDPSSFMEVSTETTGGWKSCSFVGDLHATTTLDGTSKKFDVMGEREWIAMRSHLSEDKKPFFDFQVTQRTFQTEDNFASPYACEPRFPFITIGKDFGFKCGDNYVLYQAPKSTLNAVRCNNVDTEYNPKTDYSRLIVKGKLVDPNSNNILDFDFDKFSPQERSLMHKKVEFADKSGSIQVFNNYCEGGCDRETPERKGSKGRIHMMLRCGGDDSEAVRIDFQVYQCCQGAFYSNFWLHVPPSELEGAEVTAGNLRNGFCGGWDKSSTEGAKWEADLAACSNPENVESNRYYYKGTGTGQPGSEGAGNANHMGKHLSEFYTQHDCVKSFIPSSDESIFKMFELGTKNKEWKYDSMRWDSDGKAEDPADINVVNEVKLAEAKLECTAMRRKVDNREDEQLDVNQAKDKTLLDVTGSCATDVALGLSWSDDDMKQQICEFVQAQVDIERVDIFCAQENLQALAVKNGDIAQLGNSNQTAVDGVQGPLDLYLKYRDEMKKSQGTVDYWDDGVCSLEDLDTKALRVNCAAHAFKDTQTS